MFKQLFASGQDRISLFNNTAPSFFSMVHDSIRDSIFLSITRLTDNAIVMGKHTLSLSQLLQQSEHLLDSKGVEALKTLLRDIEMETKPIRSWRNKIGAHNDLRIFEKVHQMPKIVFDSVGAVLSLFSDFLNIVGRHFGYSETDFAGVLMPGDGDAIVRSLEHVYEHRGRMANRSNN